MKLDEEEVRRLNKRLKRYGLKLRGNKIDVKNKFPFIFACDVEDVKGSLQKIIVYPKRIYVNDESGLKLLYPLPDLYPVLKEIKEEHKIKL
ncbi:MAG: hypothetical protein ACPLVJ_02025 [Candidatus Bathyarchaeales archaeon]